MESGWRQEGWEAVQTTKERKNGDLHQDVAGWVVRKGEGLSIFEDNANRVGSQ